MPEAHARRRARAREELRAQAPEADALLVTSLVNIRYLSGFSGSNAVLLLDAAGAEDGSGDLLGTDERYSLQVAEQCPDLPVVLDRVTLPTMVSTWGGRGRLAVEAEHLAVGGLRALEGLGFGPYIETAGVVEAVRLDKEPEEIAAIERACQISDAALQSILTGVHAGMTERSIARLLESAMFAAGADELSFPTIVAAGPHSAKPHHEPGHRPVAEGDLLLIDFGAAVDGYHADETRTFTVGRAADWQREIHEVVFQAQAAGRAAAVTGADLREVDAAARDVVAHAGFADYFGHGLGHGVGLQIHEAPFFSVRATGRLHGGSPVTIEPGIYLPGRGGVRIEDTIVVGEGPSRPLTSSRRDLVALG